MFRMRTARELSENHADLQVWQDTAVQGSEQIDNLTFLFYLRDKESIKFLFVSYQEKML